MPYNTRRKSLSLAELGILAPKRARAPSQPSPLSIISNIADPSIDSEPPLKKARCTPQYISPPGSMSPPKSETSQVKVEDELPDAPRGAENSPPPSPPAQTQQIYQKIDIEGIKDDVVVGVIRHLEKTNNLPITSKELAIVLAATVPIVDSSANANALIQARLSTYVKGPWPIVSPCPIGRQQESAHPRRLYYHLTYKPCQPIPDTTLHSVSRRIFTPPLSVQHDSEGEASVERDEGDDRSRRDMSMSPEVDLSTPELIPDTDMDYPSMFSSVCSLLPQEESFSESRYSRLVSPPLESGAEQDFRQVASKVEKQRRDSLQRSRQASEAAIKLEDTDIKDKDEAIVETRDENETLTTMTLPVDEVAADMFDDYDRLTVQQPVTCIFSSPMIHPRNTFIPPELKMIPLNLRKKVSGVKLDCVKVDIWSDWDDSKSPETTDLTELENMLDFN